MEVYKSSLPFLKNLKHPNGGNLGDLFHTINTTPNIQRAQVSNDCQLGKTDLGHPN
jgi:hypothetical protein